MCSNITCPEQTDSPCPEDSEPIPLVQTDQECCSTQRGCKCKPKSECPVFTCPQGQRVQVVSPAVGQPGLCCDNVHCVNDSGQCKHEDMEYQDGESWIPRECEICNCQNKLVFCRFKKCDHEPLPTCGWLGSANDSQCCKVCKGCTSPSGQRHVNGEEWEEDECTTCRCEEGSLHCQAAQCKISCIHPRKVPGRCCPVCDDVIFVTLAPHCPQNDNCTLQCANGRKQDNSGCYMCECNPDPLQNCNLDCPAGYKIDDYGGEICECISAPTTNQPKCPPLTHCKKNCSFGYKINKYGCERCRCKKCAKFSCEKKCPHGYMYSFRGCKICKCRDPELIESPDLLTVVPPISPHCMSIDGRHVKEGKTWYDGCRRCFCFEGSEWCSLITCPILQCKNPVMRPGDCCPYCPELDETKEGDTTPALSGQPTACRLKGGGLRAAGETWSLGDCTKCICHGGGVLCQIESCPPLLCNNPVMRRGTCCRVCPAEDEQLFPIPPVQATRSCTTATGSQFADGDTWRVNACQSCVCRAGQVHCFSQTCPLLTCNHTLLKKGQCCPFCVDEHVSGTCKHEGTIYLTGQSWLIENCRKCTCDHGHVVCGKYECPPPRCRRPSNIPGICCPICSNDTYEPTRPWVDQIPPAAAPNTTRARPRPEVDDIPTEDNRTKEFRIVVGALSALVVILFLAVLTLIILFCRNRRKPVEAPGKVQEVMLPPTTKATIVEVQGVSTVPNGVVNSGHKTGKMVSEKLAPTGCYDGPVTDRPDDTIKASALPENGNSLVPNGIGSMYTRRNTDKAMRNSSADERGIIPPYYERDPNDFRKSM